MNNVDRITSDERWALTFKAMTLTTFYGLLRVREIMELKHNLLDSGVKFYVCGLSSHGLNNCKGFVMLHFQTCKTD